MVRVNDDERTPPPIPPYQPYQPGPGELAEEAPSVAGAAEPPARDRDRERALESLEAKAGFRGHLTVYLLVMALLTGIWAATSFGDFYWPIFAMMGWGVAVAIHGFSLRWDREPSEDDIEAEMERLRQTRRSRGRLEE